MGTKSINELVEGEWVRTHGRNTSTIAEVTRMTKTQVIAREWGYNGREVRINRNTGKQVGANRWWYACDDPEAVRRENEEWYAERDAKNKARENAWEEKLRKSNEANPNPETILLPMNLIGISYVDSKNREGFVVIEIKPTQDYDFEKSEVVQVFEINAHAYAPRWSSDNTPSFSSMNTIRGRTEEEAMSNLIAHLWE